MGFFIGTDISIRISGCFPTEISFENNAAYICHCSFMLTKAACS